MEDRNRILWPGWETVRLIGRGSFGTVYEIQRDIFGEIEKAAMKVISIPQNQGDIEEMYSDGYDDESITSTFQGHLQSIVGEYSLMRKMNGSANIVKCDDVRYVQHDNGLGWDIFIKMELLTPLTNALSTNISNETVVKIAEDMCGALELCKKYDIVHRDIKPQNIFLSPNGDYKLGDFGIAKTVEKTMGGTKTGTYKYMAPEVYSNRPYNSTADIYSLGLVLYWLLNERRMPFLPLPPVKLSTGMDEQARNRRLSGEQLPPPAHGSKKLKQIVLRACAYDPKERYQSAEAMLADLNSLAGRTEPVGTVVTADDNNTAVQADDLTMGPDFRRAQGHNADNVEGYESDVTVGPVFGAITGIDKNDVIAETKNVKRKNNHFLIITAMLATVAVIIVLLLTQCNSGPPKQLDWSEWMETLPEYATAEYYNIEERTLYRSRNLETTSSTSESEMPGWELYDTVEGNGEFGAWSEWSATKVTSSEDRVIETQTRYRYREKETATSSEDKMSGWELTNTTYKWGEYGAWSGWSTSKVSNTDSRKVETKTQYSYRDIYTTTSSSPSLSGWTLYDTTATYGSWSGWSTTQVSGSSTLEVQTFQVYEYTNYYMYHYCTGNVAGAQYLTCPSSNSGNATFNANCVYHDLGWYDSLSYFEEGNGGYIGPKCANSCYTWYIGTTDDVCTTYYRSRPISYTYHFMKYGAWSDWSDTVYSSSSDRDVVTRTMYRYCDRKQVPVYHFYRWGDWTEWSTKSTSASDDRQVEKTSFYRYRDRQHFTRYFFRRWGEWSDYSDGAITASDTMEVQTKIQYRYRSKEN